MDRFEKHITKKVEDTIDLAIELWDKFIDDIPIRFDLTGKAAGMSCRRYGSRYLRFNMEIAKANWDKFDDVVIHEVAHYVTNILYPQATPHGKDWKYVVTMLGGSERRCHSFKVKPGRGLKEFTYVCGCREHTLTTIRHNKIRRGTRTYQCIFCKEDVKYKG